MLFALLKLAHVLGAVLIGGGLIGVWLSDLRSRQIRDLPQFSEAVRSRTPDVRMESLAGLHVRSCRAFEAE